MRLSNGVPGLVVLLSIAVLAGCGPGAPPVGSLPEEASDCPTQFEEGFTSSRAVDIGQDQGSFFEPYAEGDAVPIVKGNQGLHMIMPALSVEALPEDGEEACYRVHLDNTFPQDPAADNALQINVGFYRQEDLFVSDGVLFDAFTRTRDELAGKELVLTAKVQGSGFEGTKTVTLMLE